MFPFWYTCRLLRKMSLLWKLVKQLKKAHVSSVYSQHIDTHCFTVSPARCIDVRHHPPRRDDTESLRGTLAAAVNSCLAFTGKKSPVSTRKYKHAGHVFDVWRYVSASEFTATLQVNCLTEFRLSVKNLSITGKEVEWVSGLGLDCRVLDIQHVSFYFTQL